tara:strand:- start:193 stop:318 length:126 start_codon:yes stop_codon:yes gene_type:complete
MSGLLLAQVPENSPFFTNNILTHIAKTHKQTINIEINIVFI